jgi:ADP-heptose:LPS heptosyltransferase
LGEAATEAADIEQRLKEAYYRQVDALSPVPLAPQWADWLWNYAHNAGLVQILISTGCNAWLCRPPQNKDLAAALKIALEQKELETL